MNLKELDKLTEEGYLRRVEDGDLVVYNYSDKTTYERMWNEFTLASRGTVYKKSTGEVVAQSFPKFFNFGELSLEKQQMILNGEGPYKNYTVAEKADGSLGIIYHDGEKWRVNTRGSFSSDQAIKATEMLSKYQFLEDVNHNYTFLVEIIYPENKIIVDYGDEEKLVLLGEYDRSTGEEYNNGLFLTGLLLDMEVAKSYNYTIQEMIELQKTIPKNEEGFVVRFENGERVKFKGAEYLRIARILQGCGPLALFEKMTNGIVCREFIESIPEEILPEIEPTIEKLEDRYENIYVEIVEDFHYCMRSIVEDFHILDEKTNEERKKLGLFLKKEKLDHSGAMFPFYLGNREAVEKYIMKLLRPTGNVL